MVEDTLEPFSCRLLTVRPKPATAAAAELPKQEAGSEAQWRISGGSRGQDGVIALKAVPGAPASRAELRNFTFGRELSVCIEFVADGRVGVEFGGVDFIRDNGWLFYDKGVEELAGVVNRFAAARDGWNRLVLTVRDGRLNVHLNNKLLVYDKKLDLKPENNHLAFRTWHDNTLSFRLIHARNFVAEDPSGAEGFDIADQSREWEFGNAAEAKAAGKRLLLRASPEKGLAVADFKPERPLSGNESQAPGAFQLRNGQYHAQLRRRLPRLGMAGARAYRSLFAWLGLSAGSAGRERV